MNPSDFDQGEGIQVYFKVFDQTLFHKKHFQNHAGFIGGINH